MEGSVVENMEGFTRVSLLQEIEETNKDLVAFKKAYDAINIRALEREVVEGVLPKFGEWSGTVASLNVLIMCITRCEGVIEDLRANLERFPTGLSAVEDNHGNR